MKKKKKRKNKRLAFFKLVFDTAKNTDSGWKTIATYNGPSMILKVIQNVSTFLTQFHIKQKLTQDLISETEELPSILKPRKTTWKTEFKRFQIKEKT